MQTPIRIGTRGSPLALVQTQAVIAALAKAHQWTQAEADKNTAIIKIRTSGDRIQDRSLADLGGKGLFAKEIEEAMLAGDIDCAVHSLKDMPTFLPPGLVLDCVLEREDPRDALISTAGATLKSLRQNAVIGTSSVRRQALLLNARPDLKMVLLRGNVETRLGRVTAGDIDATILALAGLKRLNRTAAVSSIFETSEMLPAVAQGTIGIEMRESDSRLRTMFGRINHLQTLLSVTLEREYLSVLDGSCKTPIAGLAIQSVEGEMSFSGSALSPDGKQRFDVARRAKVVTVADAQAVGRSAGDELLARAGRAFFQV
ncbi:MAG: hydroxymethylbilane synthase [Micropepsaceae bacterium]